MNYEWSRQILICACYGIRILALVFAFFVLGTGSGRAAKYDEITAELCDRAAVLASRSNNVPLDVMRAISRTETGRGGENGLQPWPWTVNMEGTGRWFSTLDEARSYVFQFFKNGSRSFDVGCFQINYKWHGEKFRSIDDMFDPEINAQYAAKYLMQLFQEFGNWTDAVGAYHSRTPELAKRYTARFEQIKANLTDSVGQPTTVSNNGWRVPQSENRSGNSVTTSRPLVAGGVIALGSLVPIVRKPGGASRPFVILK